MKRILAPALLALSAALAAAPSTALAWGATGHRMVARLAAQQLTPQARARIDALLAGEPDPTLAGIANWADELRGKNPGLGQLTFSLCGTPGVPRYACSSNSRSKIILYRASKSALSTGVEALSSQR